MIGAYLTSIGAMIVTTGEKRQSAAMLRGREAVRADHRLRTDEKAIRTQSVILYKTPEPFLLLIKTVFSARMPFIRAENTVGARSAQGHPRHPTALMTLYRSATKRVEQYARGIPVRGPSRMY